MDQASYEDGTETSDLIPLLQFFIPDPLLFVIPLLSAKTLN